MAVVAYNPQSVEHYNALSSDVKPTTGVSIGALLFETDTGTWYIWTGSGWPVYPLSLVGNVSVGSVNLTGPKGRASDAQSISSALSTEDVALVSAAKVDLDNLKAVLADAQTVTPVLDPAAAASLHERLAALEAKSDLINAALGVPTDVTNTNAFANDLSSANLTVLLSSILAWLNGDLAPVGGYFPVTPYSHNLTFQGLNATNRVNEQGPFLVETSDPGSPAFNGSYKFQLAIGNSNDDLGQDVAVLDKNRGIWLAAGTVLTGGGLFLVPAPPVKCGLQIDFVSHTAGGLDTTISSGTGGSSFGSDSPGVRGGGVGTVQGDPAGTPLPVIASGTPTNVSAVAITASTPHDVYTPASGKKFRLLGYFLSVSVGAAVVFKYGGSKTEFLRTGAMAASVGVADDIGIGLAPGAADDHLYLDVTSSGTVNGYLLMGADE